jgi:TfoX/Sxy family transcriptional regulator of competence genes
MTEKEVFDMAYNEKLAERIREKLINLPAFLERKMFGGVCFLLHGNMACGILNDDVIIRVGKEAYESALALPHTRKFDITGRAMTGWVMVSHEGHASDQQLDEWLQRGVSFAASLPPK